MTSGWETELARQLIEMAAHDGRVRQRLVEDGSLFDGYHPKMEAVHRANAEALGRLLDEHGWPGRNLVGERASEAAWLIAVHAIGLPEFQRRCLALLTRAADAGEAPPRHAAMLEDGIRSREGRPQRYGTHLDWDEHGQLSPWPSLEDAAHVDARRASVGLPPLAEALKTQGAAALREREGPPGDFERRRREADEWACSVGWRER